MAKAARAGHTKGVKRLGEKTSPAKTNRFLAHWRGRSAASAGIGALTTAGRARSETDHVRQLSECAGGVARVHQEPGLRDKPARLELGVRGEQEHHVAGPPVALLLTERSVVEAHRSDRAGAADQVLEAGGERAGCAHLT